MSERSARHPVAATLGVVLIATGVLLVVVVVDQVARNALASVGLGDLELRAFVRPVR